MSAKHDSRSWGSLFTRLPILLFAALCLVPGLHAASEDAGSEAPARSEWRDSKEALLHEVLANLIAGNLDALSALTVSAEDYKRLVWPELPVSNPRNNIPFEFVFGRHNQLSRGGLAMKLREFKDRNLELVRFDERPERDRYQKIRILPIGNVVVKDGDGKTFELRLAGSILEHEGKFKVFSYKTD